ncbi:MAG: hypothetical protein KatS3mg115_0554 [Candidatus Poribacteria bacterium]|nr:MAG: hypothetical protein KatS3mg115_0554 [Candidatus Poribacteria bacterium]
MILNVQTSWRPLRGEDRQETSRRSTIRRVHEPTWKRSQAQEEAQLRARRAVVRRSHWRVLFLFGCVAVALLGIEIEQAQRVGFWGSSLFPLRQAVVIGNERYSESELIAAAGVVPGISSMLEADPFRLRERLQRAIPDLEEVTVERDVQRGVVTIRVAERRPFAQVQQGGQTHWVDERGVRLDRPYVEAPPAVPTVLVRTQEELASALLLLRLDRLYRQQSGALPEIVRVVARGPGEIVTHYRAADGRPFLVLFAADRLEEGMENIYHLWHYRLREGKTEAPLTDAGDLPDISDQSREAESSGSEVVERYDARFNGTVYIASEGKEQNHGT